MTNRSRPPAPLTSSRLMQDLQLQSPFFSQIDAIWRSQYKLILNEPSLVQRPTTFLHAAYSEQHFTTCNALAPAHAHRKSVLQPASCRSKSSANPQPHSFLPPAAAASHQESRK